MEEQNTQLSDVFIPIDYEVLKDKKIKLGGLIYVAINSHYDDIANKRKFAKEDLNYTQLTKYRAFSNTRAAVKQSIEYLIKNNTCKYVRSTTHSKYIEYDNFFDDKNKGKGYFYLSLPIRVWEIMLENMSELTLRIFFYLYREWSYWDTCRGGTVFTFSISQLCKNIGYNATSENTRKNVEKSLTFLKACGIIDYNMEKRIQKGRGWYIPLYSVSLDKLEKISFEDEKAISNDVKTEEDVPKTTIEIPQNILDVDKYKKYENWVDEETGLPF